MKQTSKIKWRTARKRPILVTFREVKKGGEVIKTREGTLIALPEIDFIIKGVKGEIYPIKKDIFYETYEVLNPDLEGCFSCGC